jgi:hypothetical protein
MLRVRQLSSADAAELFPDGLAKAGIRPARWESGCNAGRYLVFVAEREGFPVGFAVAESLPSMLHVLALGGDADDCGPLLDRLARAAGERDLWVWCPTAEARLRRVLEGRGFACRGRYQLRGRPAYLYSPGL